MEMLWRFENGTNLQKRVGQACGYFEKKYGVRAVRVMVHPGDLPGGGPVVVGWPGGEVKVEARRVVMAQHLVVTDVPGVEVSV